MMLTEKEKRKILSHPFFSELDRERTFGILSMHRCSVAEYADGEVIQSPGTEEKRAGLILCGEAQVTTKDPTKKALLRILREGDLFGVSNLFSEEAFATVITAHKRCRIFFLSKDAVFALLSENPAFLSRYLSFLCGRVCFLNRKICYLTAGSAERRLALYLAAQDKTEIQLDASLSSLSELLDVGRASLYRAFEALSRDGYIEKEGRRILLTNPDAMLKAYQ